MGAGGEAMTAAWREIDALLPRARVSRPRHRTAALLDLDRLSECAEMPLLERVARAMEGWDGRLLLAATGGGLAPDIRSGDRLVIDAAAEARDGNVVVVFIGGPCCSAVCARATARPGWSRPIAPRSGLARW